MEEPRLGVVRCPMSDCPKCRAAMDAERQALGIAATQAREIERLRADASRYAALCPPPDAATGALRIELLEIRARLSGAQAHRPAVAQARTLVAQFRTVRHSETLP